MAFIVTHPTQIFAFSPRLSGNFLHFSSIICMCVVFKLKEKRKKGEMYMCLNSCFAMVTSWFTHMYGQKLAMLTPPMHGSYDTACRCEYSFVFNTFPFATFLCVPTFFNPAGSSQVNIYICMRDLNGCSLPLLTI